VLAACYGTMLSPSAQPAEDEPEGFFVRKLELHRWWDDDHEWNRLDLCAQSVQTSSLFRQRIMRGCNPS
jgi:hypothetical protein